MNVSKLSLVETLLAPSPERVMETAESHPKVNTSGSEQARGPWQVQLSLLLGSPWAKELTTFALGILTLSLLAQVAFPLPWTPVPITGQTFGVILMALLWGRRRGSIVFAGYFIAGGLGLPVFAQGASGLALGPTFGYLVGMWAAAFVVGSLADRGWAAQWSFALLAALLGKIMILALGALWLSFWLPPWGSSVWMAGVLPFVPGEIIKAIIAAGVAFQVQRICQPRRAGADGI